jgi:hypothetical protein
MGAWGAGLYSDDYALDLRATVAAVAKLPISDEVLELLRTTELCADDPQDADHTTCWLVTADQLARRGCYPEEARRRALEIIASGANLKTLDELHAAPTMLRKRQALLENWCGEWSTPRRARKTMSVPQAFTFELGEVFTYPTSNGRGLCGNVEYGRLAGHWSYLQLGQRFTTII